MVRRAAGMITIDGVVEAGDVAPFVAVTLAASGDDERPSVSRRGPVAVITEAGERVVVDMPAEAIVLPRRKVKDRWSTLQAHPTRPAGPYHPDGYVALDGTWIAPGEPVRVIGRPIEQGFAEDTGGPREAPTQVVRRLAACAIGVGDDCRGKADKAFSRYLRATRPKAARLGASSMILAGAIGWGVLALALIAAEVSWGRGTLGAGVSAAWLCAMFAWWAAPRAPFPGGAHDRESEAEVEPGAHAVVSMLLIVPIVAIVVPLADLPAKRNAAGVLVLVFIGIFELWAAWKGVLLKPRAVAGPQVMLPRDARVRWAVLLVLLAAFVTSLVLAIPQMEGGDAMP